MTYQERLSRNVYRTLLVGFFQVFLVIIPVAVPFFGSYGLTMQDVFSLQALFGFVVLVTEVPSGYIADMLGQVAITQMILRNYDAAEELFERNLEIAPDDARASLRETDASPSVNPQASPYFAGITTRPAW